MTQLVNVLHLSDLHFGMEKTESIPSTAIDQRKLILEGLIKTLAKLDPVWRPQVVVISGDLGWQGKAADYEKARAWLQDELLRTLGLVPEKLILCPGNHDLERAKTFGLEPPQSAEKADEWLKLEHLENFSRPFAAYCEFCDALGAARPEIGGGRNRLTGRVDFSEEHIRFIVLNSAWFCRGDDDRNRLWLGQPLLEKLAANGSRTRKNMIILHCR